MGFATIIIYRLLTHYSVRSLGIRRRQDTINNIGFVFRFISKYTSIINMVAFLHWITTKFQSNGFNERLNNKPQHRMNPYLPNDNARSFSAILRNNYLLGAINVVFINSTLVSSLEFKTETWSTAILWIYGS